MEKRGDKPLFPCPKEIFFKSNPPFSNFFHKKKISEDGNPRCPQNPLLLSKYVALVAFYIKYVRCHTWDSHSAFDMCDAEAMWQMPNKTCMRRLCFGTRHSAPCHFTLASTPSSLPITPFSNLANTHTKYNIKKKLRKYPQKQT